MRKPKRLVKSVFEGNFHDNHGLPGSIADFRVSYNHLEGIGKISIRFFIESTFDLGIRVRAAISLCGMQDAGNSSSDNLHVFSASIPAKSRVDGDMRVQELIHNFLESLGVSGFQPNFRMTVLRGYEVCVPDPDTGGMRWISEGQYAQESIAACFN